MSRFLSLQRHAIYVLAAALFGASAPIAKLLLERMSPVTLAAVAYCGGGVALVCAWLTRRIRSNTGAGDGPATAGRWTHAAGLSMTGAIVEGLRHRQSPRIRLRWGPIRCIPLADDISPPQVFLAGGDESRRSRIANKFWETVIDASVLARK